MSVGDEAVRYGMSASTRLFLAVAASVVFVSVLTATMINVLIPLIRTQFGACAAEVGWVVTGYCTLGWRPITPRRVRVGVVLEQGVPMEQQAFPTGGGEEAASVARLPNAEMAYVEERKIS